MLSIKHIIVFNILQLAKPRIERRFTQIKIKYNRYFMFACILWSTPASERHHQHASWSCSSCFLSHAKINLPFTGFVHQWNVYYLICKWSRPFVICPIVPRDSAGDKRWMMGMGTKIFSSCYLSVPYARARLWNYHYHLPAHNETLF